MSLDYFRVERGYSFDENDVQMITGNGVPGVSGDSTTVGVASIFFDATSGAWHQKRTAGTGADKWTKIATIDDVNAAISWREPAEVRSTAATLPTGTPGSPISDFEGQGVTINDSDRVLFSELSAGNKNVYEYDQANGIFVPDPNRDPAIDGDAVYIQDGNDAGKIYAFNGVNWVLINQSALTEQAFIQAYIGKASNGNVMPDYPSNNIVTDGDDLTVAIGDLDAQMGAAITSSGQVIIVGMSIYDAIRALDSEFANAYVRKKVTGITSQQVVDSVLVDVAAHVKWTINMRSGGNVLAFDVEATHDGVEGGADAGSVDRVRYAKLKMGANIAGLAIDVVLTGSGAAQVMELRAASTDPVDVLTARTIIPF